jgi:protein-export membrane protein SecD
MKNPRPRALWVIIFIGLVAFYIVKGGKDFVLGLDLAGGSALTYKIDVSSVPPSSSVDDSINALRDVIERRVNLFGVREPTVNTEYSRLSNEWRLIVELPGITDVVKAGKTLGDTPVLEFRTLSAIAKEKLKNSTSTIISMTDFEVTELTGKYLQRSDLVFDKTTNKPIVQLNFDDTGTKLFADITRNNIGQQVAIFLDGTIISAPVVQSEITAGTAVITGNFSVEDARALVGRLNSGALPLPVTLIGTTVIGPSLGTTATNAGMKASMIGFALVVIFMMLWYRLPGLVASLALVAYSIMMLALFKVIPVTLTSAGVAGFIISVGLAVDANVLTFERMKEELRGGKGLKQSIEDGFARAWTSIRDSHIAAILVSIILFWFGTSIVKGFAFTFFLGAVVSLISAQLISRVFLRAVASDSKTSLVKFLFGSGFF